LHSVKLKPARGSRATRAANRCSRGSAIDALAPAGRAPSSSCALDVPGRQTTAAATAGVRRTGRARMQAVRTGYVTSEVM
jgi:hypothetical protein